MSSSKALPRREWMLGVLGLVGATTLVVAGCENTAEDAEKFPPVDTSQAAKSSDAPLATDKDDSEAIKRKKK